MKVIRFPLVRITFWFVMGILLAYYTSLSPKITFGLLGILGCLLGVSYFFTSKRKPLIFGLTSILLSCSVGVCTWIAHDETLKKNHYINQFPNDNNEYDIEISLIEKLKSSAYKFRYVAAVKKFDGKVTFGKIVLNLERNVTYNELVIGSNLLIHGKIVKNKRPDNPNQFDYGRYLDNKSIPAQLYVKNISISPDADKSMFYYACKIRDRVLINLRKNNFNETELNLVMALILGQQQEISPEILNDYQFAGAVHVLSVSGLHIGFILMFINFLLKPLPKNKSGNLIRFIMICICLLGFAVIAGLSPSVIRSVTMFTFVAGGMCLNRDTNIFHTLLVSILLILLFEPSFLFDVGFQLSYISLFAILWLQPAFAKLWQPKAWLTKQFWDILTVSFAAQIGAFPLSIYYFHQFPGSFFLTNLVIFPALFVIMSVGVFVVILAVFGFVPLWPMLTLEYTIRFLNYTISWIASFRQLTIKDIPLNAYTTASLYFMIIAFGFWFKKTSFNRILFLLLTVVGLQTTLITTQFYNQRTQELIVLQNAKNSTLIQRNGLKIKVSCNEKILNEIAESRILKPYLLANFCSITKKQKIRNVDYFAGRKILVVDSMGIIPKNYNPDVMLIRQSPNINLSRILQIYHPEVIVADGSNFKSYVQLWKATCRKEKIPFHATAEKGFFRLE